MNEDRADSSRLGEALKAIIPALEEFSRYAEPDQSGARQKEWKAVLEQTLPQKGVGLDNVLSELSETFIPNGARNGMPGFSGWITTSPTTSAIVANLAGSVAGSQRWWVQSFNTIEKVALDWLADLLGLPSDWQGTFSSGGSIANIIGLAAARQYAFEQIGVDPASEGVNNSQSWRIYSSSEVHHVNIRAAAILGMGRNSVVQIPPDNAYRIDVNELETLLKNDKKKGIRPLAIIATTGTVNTGAIDPLAPIADLADEYNSWLHVDGAYGGFGVLDERLAPQFEGLLRAGSFAVDPHKWLAAPVGIGATFVRDRLLLGRALTLEPAEYLEGATSSGEVASTFDQFGELLHDYNLEQSAPSRGVSVWAILKEIGAEGMRDRIVRHNDFARRLQRLVEEDEYLEVLSPATLSICCFRYLGKGKDDKALNELNTEIARLLRSEGRLVPSTTEINGRIAIRPCYINPRGTQSEVDALVQRVRELGDEITGKQ
ncbi:MAG: aminotransferase class I/II-fold pyridoxal phosphate-dependent enzyme [Anaerolineales bacterium]